MCVGRDKEEGMHHHEGGGMEGSHLALSYNTWHGPHMTLPSVPNPMAFTCLGASGCGAQLVVNGPSTKV